MKRLIISSIISLYFCCYGLTQKRKSLYIIETYSIETTGILERGEIMIPIPTDYPNRQIIQNIKYSKSPRFLRTNSMIFALFDLTQSDLRSFLEIEIIIEMDIFDYDLSVAKEIASTSELKKGEQKRYVKTNGFYKLKEESLANLDYSASSIKIENTRMIHDFVKDHLQYRTQFGKDLGAQYALDAKNGDCTEYAELMISLCRYNNYPSRSVEGFTVENNDSSPLGEIFKSTDHTWVEIFFNEYGWVPFDPTHSDGSSRTNFDNLDNKYIYMSFSKPEERFTWMWWGDGKLIVNRDRKINIIGTD